MPSDLTFSSNITNQRKKQTKYKQSIELKNNLTIVRGESGGDSGEWGLQELL